MYIMYITWVSLKGIEVKDTLHEVIRKHGGLSL